MSDILEGFNEVIWKGKDINEVIHRIVRRVEGNKAGEAHIKFYFEYVRGHDKMLVPIWQGCGLSHLLKSSTITRDNELSKYGRKDWMQILEVSKVIVEAYEWFEEVEEEAKRQALGGDDNGKTATGRKLRVDSKKAGQDDDE